MEEINITNEIRYIINKRNIDVNNHFYFVIVSGIEIMLSEWGYYIYSEPLDSMDLYVSEQDYCNLHTYYNFDKKIIDSNNFLISTNSASFIKEYILKNEYIVKNVYISCGHVKNLGDSENFQKNSFDSMVTSLIFFKDKKDLSKFKLTHKNCNITEILSISC